MKESWINGRGHTIAEYKRSKSPRIIAISGKYGSGKDTIMNEIREFLSRKIPDEQIEDLKFADSLKIAGAEILGIPVEDMYSSEGKSTYLEELDMTNGRFQQLLGTILRQGIHPDIWVINVFRKCKEETDKIFLITDCRFQNEAIGIQKLGGVVIRLNRSDHLISEKSKAGRDPTHISETDLDDYPSFDLVYQNDGTLDQLIKNVFHFLRFDLPDFISL